MEELGRKELETKAGGDTKLCRKEAMLAMPKFSDTEGESAYGTRLGQSQGRQI